MNVRNKTLIICFVGLMSFSLCSCSFFNRFKKETTYHSLECHDTNEISSIDEFYDEITKNNNENFKYNCFKATFTTDEPFVYKEYEDGTKQSVQTYNVYGMLSYNWLDYTYFTCDKTTFMPNNTPAGRFQFGSQENYFFWYGYNIFKQLEKDKAQIELSHYNARYYYHRIETDNFTIYYSDDYHLVAADIVTDTYFGEVKWHVDIAYYNIGDVAKTTSKVDLDTFLSVHTAYRAQKLKYNHVDITFKGNISIPGETIFDEMWEVYTTTMEDFEGTVVFNCKLNTEIDPYYFGDKKYDELYVADLLFSNGGRLEVYDHQMKEIKTAPNSYEWKDILRGAGRYSTTTTISLVDSYFYGIYCSEYYEAKEVGKENEIACRYIEPEFYVSPLQYTAYRDNEKSEKYTIKYNKYGLAKKITAEVDSHKYSYSFAYSKKSDN